MRFTALTFAALLPTLAVALDFEGTSLPVQSTNVANSGLDHIYVAPTTAGLTMVYDASSTTSAVKWYRFTNLGAAYAEEVTPQRSGSRLTLEAADGDAGYIIEEGSTRYSYWLVDYSKHELSLRGLTPADRQECDAAVLNFTGEADEIPFYTLTGRRMSLPRGLELRYHAAEFDETIFAFNTVETVRTLDGVGSVISVSEAYCSTNFELSGDRFTSAWNDEMSVISDPYTPYGLTARTRATQTLREVDNEQTEDNVDGLGGSAPCEILFEAAVTESAIFTEWQLSRSSDFSILENSYSELNFTYTFTDNGTTYVRFVANNADGTCEYIGDTYEVFIGESKLLIPNAFSPEASPGVNDEWKVSYKSLVSYECHIFNRWGTLMFSSKDPAEGWDGKHKGKYVPAGVYFYVIKARGADGINYDKAGDINIVKYKQGSASGTVTE